MTTTRSLALVIITFVLFTGCASKYRADESLVSAFQAHKAEFNTLLEMFRNDKGLVYFSRGYTLPENAQSVGVSQERLEQYQRLFSALGLDGMAAADRQTGSRDEVWFFTSIAGTRPSTFKHYAHVSRPTKGVIQDLDKEGSKANPYRHVEGNWYLVLDDAD